MALSPTPLRPTDERSVLALSGGVGGAKLALGLARVLPPGNLTVVANTGDDFEHLGLHVSPDLDTLTYVLAGLDNPQTGWGRRNETWSFMEAIAEIGGETWFRLGDRDLALHVERTRRLKAGETLTQITADLTRRFGIASRVLPMADDPVRTRVETREGMLDFQRYFVARQCAPEVTGFVFDGAERATPQEGVLQALRHPGLRAVIICPSNPFISIDPILAVPGLRQALTAATAPVIAVSPIIAGRAVKGPTAKMMAELGLTVDPLTVAAHYRGLIDGYVLDEADSGLAALLDLPVEATRTLMQSLDDREALARAVLDFADRIAARAAKRMSGGRS
ncbi:MAG TPA: 2-phospho-L-lactate transferase [Xanthobacteraceae bacterium]